jgi:hypothetical protein
MLFNSHDSANRTLRLGWRVLLLWTCGVPGWFVGLIAGKLLQGDAPFFSSRPISPYDILAQLAIMALPVVMFVPITWLLLALLQKFTFVDFLSRTRAAWFTVIGFVIGLLWGITDSFKSGPIIY